MDWDADRLHQMATGVTPKIDPMGPKTAPLVPCPAIIKLLNHEGTVVGIGPPRKVMTVIPARRKSVKTIVYHSILEMKFAVLLEDPHPATVDGTQLLNSDMPAATENCRVGVGGKVKSVIPKRRKLVKTMMYHSIKDFFKSLFRPSPELHNRRKPISHDF